MGRGVYRSTRCCAPFAARLVACLLPLAHVAAAQTIISAAYTDPTTRYAHGILGDAIEHGALVIKLSNAKTVTITLLQSDVFENAAPRLLDVDADGSSEVVVVQSNA